MYVSLCECISFSRCERKHKSSVLRGTVEVLTDSVVLLCFLGLCTGSGAAAPPAGHSLPVQNSHLLPGYPPAEGSGRGASEEAQAGSHPGHRRRRQ